MIGTSIGALNGAIIAGNAAERRLERLAAFWQGLARPSVLSAWGSWELPFEPAWRRMEAMWFGAPGLYGPGTPLGGAALYDPAPLRERLERLVDIAQLNAGAPRFTVGAVSAATGAMRYFDTRERRLGLDHVMAFAALPLAFPPVQVDGESFWDGGIYSNTPIEAVLAVRRRRELSSLRGAALAPRGRSAW